MATNVQIDFGFVISAFVPLVFLYILGEGNLSGVWRGSLGLGVLFPILVLRKSRNRPLYYTRSTLLSLIHRLLYDSSLAIKVAGKYSI
jgi:hypothetical protein